MKKTKLFGAVALSAALAIGTAMPAFAVESDEYGVIDEGTPTNISNASNPTDATSKGETTVYLGATNTQIKATIPLSIAVYGKSTGGALITPRESVYTLANESADSKLYVSQVDAQLLSAAPTINGSIATVDWTGANAADLTTAAGGLVSASNTNVDGKYIPSATAGSMYTTQAKIGSVYMNLTGGQLKSTAPNGNAYTDGGIYIDQDDQHTIMLIGNGKFNTTEKTGWVIDAAGNDPTNPAESSILGLRLEGYSSALSTSALTPDTLVELMKITYTVQASAAFFDGENMVETQFTYPAA